MADTVSTKSAGGPHNERVYVFTGISDGTGESGVVKIDKSALTLAGVEPTAINILTITANIQGYAYVSLKFDHTTDDNIVVLGAGSFYEDFRDYGGLKDEQTGGTGDIILTSSGAFSGASYTIVLRVGLI